MEFNTKETRVDFLTYKIPFDCAWFKRWLQENKLNIPEKYI